MIRIGVLAVGLASLVHAARTCQTDYYNAITTFIYLGLIYIVVRLVL